MPAAPARPPELGCSRLPGRRGGHADDKATVCASLVDAYLMLHRQSNPSCTTLETLACCVAVVGYHNMTLGGILALADVGVGVAMDDVAAAAAPGRR